MSPNKGILECSNPILGIKIGMAYRCRKCPECVNQRRLEWVNRMFLESYNKPYRPFFGTMTFNQANYLDSPKHVLTETQKTFKRLRRNGHDLRYFMAIERGTKKKRLHNHFILWSESLSSLPWNESRRIVHNAWGNGAIKWSQSRSTGSLFYTSKYLLKDLGEHIDQKTGEIKNCRNYTWSNKPALGSEGIKRWQYVVSQAHLLNNYNLQNLPPNWINIPIFGKLEKAYIPSRQYIKFCQDKLNIDFHPEIEYKIDTDQILENHERWLDVEKTRREYARETQ